MKQTVFALLILLISFLAYAADDAKPDQLAPDRLTVGMLLNTHADLFERKATADSPEDILGQPISFIASETLPHIHEEIMRIKGLLQDPDHGCKKRAETIKAYLDQKKIWNLLVYIGVFPRDRLYHSPFYFGPSLKWQFHWFNVVATNYADGPTFVIFDPRLLPLGPEPLHIGLNKLVGADELVDRNYNYRYLGPGCEPEEPSKPSEKDLFLTLDERFARPSLKPFLPRIPDSFSMCDTSDQALDAYESMCEFLFE